MENTAMTGPGVGRPGTGQVQALILVNEPLCSHCQDELEGVQSQRLAKTEDPLQAREITSGFLAATMVSTDTARSTSVTLMVPRAEDRRPAKG
mmetsp:Transcript_15070/g.31532  ORF Transcript_15070/g.31532 Transcript_15070/m.31532 type:complete len:93 (+) Transcript_15070:214-492(+)